jgi:hypothetical protein
MSPGVHTERPKPEELPCDFGSTTQSHRCTPTGRFRPAGGGLTTTRTTGRAHKSRYRFAHVSGLIAAWRSRYQSRTELSARSALADRSARANVTSSTLLPKAFSTRKSRATSPSLSRREIPRQEHLHKTRRPTSEGLQ